LPGDVAGITDLRDVLPWWVDVFALTVTDSYSNRPDYPARLARVLAKTEPDVAKTALARAERMLGDWEPEEIGKWLRDIVDDARERLSLPNREW
jgi:hypothetical protein